MADLCVQQGNGRDKVQLQRVCDFGPKLSFVGGGVTRLTLSVLQDVD